MQQSRSELRHAIRGMLNALKLCVTALEMPLTTSEKLQFLSDVEFAAGRLAEFVAELETVAEETDSDESPVTSAADVIGRSV